MRQMKYVVLERDGEERIFMFPESVQHSHMASMLSCLGAPVRAGFVYFTPRGLMCSGSSVSLKLQSSQKDTEMLNRQLGND